MKKWIKVTSILCAAALTAAMAMTSFGETPVQGAAMNTVQFDGTVGSVSDGRLTLIRDFGNGISDEVLVTISDETKVLNAENGYPIPLENLTAGEAVRVYTGMAMTMSLPPITNGIMILADAPADGAFPVYTTVTEFAASKGPGNADVLAAADGTEYMINGSTMLLPYLTRNIVTAQDLTAGTDVLIWADANGTAQKIVIFQAATDVTFGETGAPLNGWQETSEGWYFYEQGKVRTGWFLDGSDWYCLDPETGLMQTGFVTLGGKTYFLEESGRMLTKPRVFTPDENGELH